MARGAPSLTSEETTVVPDSVYGAILLSIIDFFLSFAIIAGIGAVLSFFPYLNRLGEIDEKKLREGGH
ncbi:MAG: hypothetical protein JNM60_11820 [Candidatus Competibacteraceae bacterium]|nr:hypothetical protein [Candidatus Competibacteraceae bacterium]